MSDHPSTELLRLFHDRLTDSDQTAQVTRHLLDGCEQCRSRLTAFAARPAASEASTIAEDVDPFEVAVTGALETTGTTGLQANVPANDADCPSAEQIADLQARAGSQLEVSDLETLGSLVECLLAGCPVCRERAQQATSAETLTDPAVVDDIWESAVQAAVDREEMIAEETASAPQLVQELLSLEFEDQSAVLRSDKRFHTWAVAEELLEQAFAIRFDDPREMLRRNELALEATQLLSEEHYGERVLDLQARAWAELSNPQRVRGMAEAAQTSIDRSVAISTSRPFDQRVSSTVTAFQALLYVGNDLNREAVRWSRRLLANNPTRSDRRWFQDSAAIFSICLQDLAYATPSAVSLNERIEAYQRAARRAREVGDQEARGAALLNLAVLTANEDEDRAKQLIAEAEFTAIAKSPSVRTTILAMRGEIAMKWGRYADAISLIGQAIEDMEALGRHEQANRSRLHYSFALAANGQFEEAQLEAQKAYTFHQANGASKMVLKLLRAAQHAQTAWELRLRLEGLHRSMRP